MSDPTGPITANPIALRADAAPPRARRSGYPEPYASQMAGRTRHPLGDLFGLSRFGVNRTVIEPGGVSSLRHAHRTQDEFIYVLVGHPTLFTDAGATPLAPGMCAGFAAGSGNAHQLRNDTSEPVEVLEVGDRSPDDAVTYPDDDLAGTFVAGAWHFTRRDGTPHGQAHDAPARS